MKFLLGIIWTLACGFIFYKYQGYYFDALKAWPFFLYILVLIFAGAFGILKLFHKKNSLSIFWIFFIGFIFSLFFAGYKFLEYDMAVLRDIHLVQEDNTIIAYEELPEGVEALFEKDEVVIKSSRILSFLPENVSTYFEKAGISSFFTLLGKILLNLFAASVVVIVLASIGFIFTSEFLIASALGIFILSLSAYLFTLLGIFKAQIFIPFAILLTLGAAFLNRKKLLGLFKSSFDFKENKISKALILSVIAALLGMYFIDFIRVIPVSWDDTNFYAYYAKLMAGLNEFPHGIGSFAWLNLGSINWLISDSFQGMALLSFISTVLGFIALRKLLSRWTSGEIATLLSLLFFTLPFIQYQQFIDFKSELPLFFIGVLTIDKLFDYIYSRNKKDLIVFAALLSLTFAIKIVSLFLIGAIFISVLVSRKFSIKEILSVGGILFVLTAPWTIYNYLDSPNPTLLSPIFGSSPTENKLVIEKNYCEREEPVNIDYGRYSGDLESVKDYAQLPFRIFVSPEINSILTDFSFIFAALLGFLLLYSKKVFSNKTFQAIGLATLIYIVLWTLGGKAVIWYGIFLFPGLLILFGNLIIESKNAEKKFLIGLIVFAIFSNLLIRQSLFANPQLFANGLGLIKNDELSDYIFPGYKDVVSILENEEDVLLYRSGTLIPYFLNLPLENYSNDNLLELWACVEKADDETIREIFADKKISHVLVHEEADTSISDEQYINSHKKLLDFLERSGWQTVYRDHGLWLLKL